METNEQGLTKEERFMFYLLSIILIVAIGVLVVKSFSDNERVLEEAPITEKDVTKDNIEEETTSKSDSSLIEETNDNNVIEKTNTSYNTSKKNSLLTTANKKTQVIATTVVKPENKNEGTGSTSPVINTWNFKSNIITKAYSGEKINIDKNVILNDGTEREAQVTLRKLIDDTYMIIDISAGYIIATPGTYKYYYTYADVTKELILTVYDTIDVNSISFLNLKDEIIDDSIEKEELTSYKETIKNTTIKVENETVNLTFKKTKSSSNQIPLIVNVNYDLQTTTSVSSSTFGVVATAEQKAWYDKLSNNQLIVWINTDIVKASEIKLNIDGVEYLIKVNIKVIDEETEDKDDSDNKTEIEDKEETEEKIPDEGPKPDKEPENIVEDNNNFESTIENNIVASIPNFSIGENTSQ